MTISMGITTPLASLLFLLIPWLFGLTRTEVIEEESRQTIAAASQKILEVENTNGSIKIQGWSKDEMEMVATKRAPSQDVLDRIKIELEQDQEKIRIQVELPKDKGASWRRSPSVELEIKLPKRMGLKLITSNGDIEVKDMDETINARTTNGGIRSKGIRGNLMVETANGAIHIEDIEGSVSARNTNGKISFTGVRGCASAQTINGSIEAEVRSAANCEHLRFKTTNGSVRVRVEPSGIGTLIAHTSSGTIDADLPNSSVVTKSSTYTEIKVSGGKSVMEVTTSNGSIQVSSL